MYQEGKESRVKNTEKRLQTWGLLRMEISQTFISERHFGLDRIYTT